MELTAKQTLIQSIESTNKVGVRFGNVYRQYGELFLVVGYSIMVDGFCAYRYSLDDVLLHEYPINFSARYSVNENGNIFDLSAIGSSNLATFNFNNKFYFNYRKILFEHRSIKYHPIGSKFKDGLVGGYYLDGKPIITEAN